MPTQFPDQLGAGGLWSQEKQSGISTGSKVAWVSCLFCLRGSGALLGSVASMPGRQSSDKKNCSWRFLKPLLTCATTIPVSVVFRPWFVDEETKA